MYEVVLSESFKRELKRLIKRNPKLRKKVGKTLELLNNNIRHPSLKLHKLSGTDYWSVSVTDSYRIKLKICDRYIFCIEFGRHEEIY